MHAVAGPRRRRVGGVADECFGQRLMATRAPPIRRGLRGRDEAARARETRLFQTWQAEFRTSWLDAEARDPLKLGFGGAVVATARRPAHFYARGPHRTTDAARPFQAYCASARGSTF
jgi:hypothetical protein